MATFVAMNENPQMTMAASADQDKMKPLCHKDLGIIYHNPGKKSLASFPAFALAESPHSCFWPRMFVMIIEREGR